MTSTCRDIERDIKTSGMSTFASDMQIDYECSPQEDRNRTVTMINPERAWNLWGFCGIEDRRCRAAREQEVGAAIYS